MFSKVLKRNFNYLIFILSSLFFTACGEGIQSSNTSSLLETGKFIDAPVQNLRYKTPTMEGYTDENGTFQYKKGEKIEFFIGNLSLGEVTTDTIITPYDLAGDKDINNPSVKTTNIARILQSLDKNKANSDVITIDEKLHDINISNVNLESNNESVITNILDEAKKITKETYNLVDKQEALNEMYQSVKKHKDTTPPTITSSSTYNIYENQTDAFTITATDENNITYSISGDDATSFNIYTATGEVSFKTAPDYETKSTYSLVVIAIDSNNNKSSKNITINIIDTDESLPDTTPPTIKSSSTYSVNENQTEAFTISATDKSSITYSISGNDATSFNIDTNTGEITFKTAPDYETKNTYSLIVKATDSNNNESTKNVTINIIDIEEIVPDNTPPTITSLETYSVNENQTEAFTAAATDKSTLTYSINGTDKDSFNIEASTGKITFKTAPNYEEKNSYSLIVQVMDSHYNASTKNITINILDINDNPTITSPNSTSVEENQLDAMKIVASDEDNDTVTYSIGGIDKDSFDIDTTTGEITFKTAPNYETKKLYDITALANDGESNTSQDISINITNTNDSPTISAQWQDIDSWEDNSTSNYSFSISDEDEDNLTIFLESNNSSIITIDSNFSNQLSPTQYLDKTLEFNISVDDSSYGLVEITLNISDEMGSSDKKSLLINIKQNNPPIANAGENQSIDENTTLTLDASDSNDSDGQIVSYEWKKEDTVLSTDKIFETSELSSGYHTITLSVTDNKGATSTDTVNIAVQDSQVLSHDGVDYGTTISLTTGKIWLDRNLGATKVCTSMDDTECFGDYFQWGRKPDGHEKSDSMTEPVHKDYDILEPAHGKFLRETVNNVYGYDWTGKDESGVLRAKMWNPCPTGFRVPYQTELEAENITSGTDGFTKLKLPLSGERYGSGNMDTRGYFGFLWSKTVTNNKTYRFKYLETTVDGGYEDFRANGRSVRCIEGDYLDNQTPIANAGNNSTIIEGSTVSFSALDSTDGDGSIVSYEWKEEDTVLSTNMSFEKSDFSVGVHTISVTVTDNDGDSSSHSITIAVKNNIPTTPPFESGETWKGLVYETVTSPYTKRVWLDRNIGASQACTAADDEACYGDYYQYGRNSDGHENKYSEVTNTLATDTLDVGHGKFISSVRNSDGDWADYRVDDTNVRFNNWINSNGLSICPTGFRVPTTQDYENERVHMEHQLISFDSFLKPPSAGYRSAFDMSAKLETVGKNIKLWSLSKENGLGLAHGKPVRCIKDNGFDPFNIPPVANAGDDQTVDEYMPLILDASSSTDSDGNVTTYEWKEGDTVLSNEKVFETSSLSAGFHTITLTIKDDQGGELLGIR